MTYGKPINPYFNGTLILTRASSLCNVETTVSSTVYGETTGYPHAKKKKWSWTSTLQHMQKLTRRGSNYLNLRANHTTLKREHRYKYSWFGFGNKILGMTPKA